MDPNATLAELNAAREEGLTLEAATKRHSLCEDLHNWLAKEGFEPDWEKFPRAASYFVMWQLNVAGV